MNKLYTFIFACLTILGIAGASAQDIQTGLVKFKNRRTSTSYLTTKEAGSAVGAAKANDLSQVWFVQSSGTGYTVRSANTAQYLQSDWSAPSSSATTLYIRNSPNASGFVNVSSASDFSGSTCLNLGNDGKQLNKWSADAGSDWTMEIVSDVTEEQIKQHLESVTGCVSQLEEGKYYNIVSAYGRAMVDGSDISTQVIDPTNLKQVWTLKKNGDYWRIQNAISEKFITRQTQTSTPFHSNPQAYVDQFSLQIDFRITYAGDGWISKWTIAYPQDTQGLHDATGQDNKVVLWSTSAAASQWTFQEVSVTPEDIEAARNESATFDNVVANKAVYQAYLDALFTDKACTTLKEDVQALTDDQLKANENFAGLTKDMQDMVLKIKNNTWQQFKNKTTGYTADYERFFRIADYKIYSNYQQMANSSNFTMSNSFGKLSGPTGIVADAGDIIYVYANTNSKSGCTFQLEAVSTDGVPGNHQIGDVTTLRQGLNLFRFDEQKMLYIFYQAEDPSKQLSIYPDIKVHIEGGKLNGYWDATRGMTNADWKLLQQDLLKASPVLNLKTDHLVFCMNADLVKQCEPNEMEGLMRIWDMIPTNEERYMGVEDFEGRFRNIWNVFSIDYNYMFASTYGTYYNESTLPTIMNYENMRKPGNLWGPSHEIGHNHQASINVIGTTESSNNMFSNINTFEQGIWQTRRQIPVDVFAELGKNTPWLQRNIWNTTSMYFQLYLYFHAMHNDDNFLPNLFRMMRKKPINKWSGPAGTGPTSYGKDDYLHLAKMICDVAKADLSEFFEAYGMFVPVEMVEVGDYSTYFVTTTQAEIDAAKKYMKKYPKKLGNIMFIDDHIIRHKANPDNIFEGIAADDGLVVENFSQHDEVAEYKNLPKGDVGDYEEFDGSPEYDVSNDSYTLSGSTITFRGNGYIGHKFYDNDGNLIWATNAKKVTLPARVTKLGSGNYKVVACEANGNDVPCPLYNAATSRNYASKVYFGNDTNVRTWNASATTDFGEYLPTNAIAVVTSDNAPENVTNATNVISKDNTAKAIVISGDAPFYLPVDVQAESVAFKKTLSKMTALQLPFDVNSEQISDLKTLEGTTESFNIVDATNVAAGAPVVVSKTVNISLGETALKTCNFQALEEVNVLGSDGTATHVATATPFTYVLDNLTAINAVSADGGNDAKAAETYDLSGRRVNNITRRGIYVRAGKKFVVK